jgi:GntR family transcriptional regulator
MTAITTDLDTRDRRSLVTRVRDGIAQMIVSEQYQPSQRLPTEPELASRFGVSRSTLREALKQLEEDHLIYCIHGVGRFVAHPSPAVLEQDITQLTSVSELASALGITLEARILDFRVEPASEELARDLAIAAGEPIVRLDRVRTAKGEPVIFSVDQFPRSFCPGEPDRRQFEGSLLKTMAAWGIELAYSQAIVKAVTLDHRTAKAIGVPVSLPWILLEQVNYNSRHQPVLASRDYHRGDEFRFSVLRRRRGQLH